VTLAARSRGGAALLAAMIFSGLACNNTPAFSPDAAATAVAATVAALVPPTPSPEVPATVEEHGLPSAEPAAPSPELRLAYTDAGNVDFLTGAGPATVLTASGSVEQIRLSDDGSVIAYTRRPVVDEPVELRAVHSDGTGDVLLMGPSDFDALYPLAGARHHDLSEFEFLPGTHVLLLNTRSTFEGPGLAKHDDMLRIDVDSLARTMLLAPGSGGDFVPSPDGRYLALSRSDLVEILLADGSPSGSGTIAYDPVITYSEYAYYAQPVWNSDSTAIALAIPSRDPLAPSTSGSIWRLPVGAPATLVATLEGQFFLMTSYAPLVSPDLAKVVFTRPTTTPNVVELYRSAVDGSGETLVGEFGAWMGWSPDSAHFVYGAADPTGLLLADASGASTPLVVGTDLRWYTPADFLYLSGSMGGWTIERGAIGSAPSGLASPGGDFVDYDFTYR